MKTEKTILEKKKKYYDVYSKCKMTHHRCERDINYFWSIPDEIKEGVEGSVEYLSDKEVYVWVPNEDGIDYKVYKYTLNQLKKYWEI